MPICILCEKEFKWDYLLDRHHQRKTLCKSISNTRLVELINKEKDMDVLIDAYETELDTLRITHRDELEQLRERYDARLEVREQTIEENRSNRSLIYEEITKLKDMHKNMIHKNELLEKEIEALKKELMNNEKRMLQDANTINRLIGRDSNSGNKTVNINNGTVNTIVIEAAMPFTGSIINKPMELEYALNGAEGIAEYISICSIVDKQSQLRCYYVTDASRANGVFLNGEGEWIKDEGGEIMKGIFINVARELKKVLYNYERGLYDDIANEENMPDEIVADIRRARAALIKKSRNELINPVNTYVRSVMKCYRGKVPGEFKDIKHYQIKME